MTTAPSPTIITGVDFVPLPTRDLEAAVAFYGETLGLQRSAYRPDRGFAEFETGNLTLNIISPERMGLEFHGTRNAPALHGDDPPVLDQDGAAADLPDGGVHREDMSVGDEFPPAGHGADPTRRSTPRAPGRGRRP